MIGSHGSLSYGSYASYYSYGSYASYHGYGSYISYYSYGGYEGLLRLRRSYIYREGISLVNRSFVLNSR